jgi:ATP-dependent Clp protease ATP-binding subunit ClpA
MYERFTDRSRKVMQLANQQAQKLNHEYIGTEHILLGLVKEGSGVAANVFKNLGIDPNKIALKILEIVQPCPSSEIVMGRLPHTPRAKKVLEYSIEESRLLGHNHVGTEHLLLGLVRETEGIAAVVLTDFGLTLDRTREAIRSLLEGLCKPPEDAVNQQVAFNFSPTVIIMEKYKHLFKDESSWSEFVTRLSVMNETILVLGDNVIGSILPSVETARRLRQCLAKKLTDN